MDITFAAASPARLREVIRWLQEEHEVGGDGFYCNANVIEHSFAERKVVCALAEEKVVGFSVFYIVPPASGLSIIEVHPQYRKRGVGRKLMAATLMTLSQRGALYVTADCTSEAGMALCKGSGFQPRVDCNSAYGAAVIARLWLELPRKPALPDSSRRTR